MTLPVAPAQVEVELPPGRCAYLYCVQRSDSSSEPPIRARLGDGVTRLRTGPLDAIVEAVLRSDFNETNLTDSAWLLRKLPVHETVVEEAMASAAVLPSRFGTLFSSFSAVRECLERDRDRLLATLLAVEEADEWGVELTGTPTGPAPAPTGLSSPASGTAFLLAKKAERQRRLSTAREAAGLAAHAFAELARFARDAKRVPAPILKASFLVRRDGLESFRLTLDRMAGESEFDGLAFRLSGPWPPYNFCEGAPTKGDCV